jgi:hypothetical protein
MKHEFHPAALQEYAEAVQFFAQQDKQQDFIDTIALGAGFANENAIFRVISAPERWPIVDGSDPSLFDHQVFIFHLISSRSRSNCNCSDRQLSPRPELLARTSVNI